MANKRINKTGRKKLAAKPQAGHGDRADIRVGDISGGTGIAIGPQAQATVIQSSAAPADEIAQAFAALQQKVADLPEGPDKSVAQNAVGALEAEARKGEQATESAVQKWLSFLAETAPDVWEVAVDMFTNPIKGVGTVFRKISDRAKAERAATTDEAAKK